MTKKEKILKLFNSTDWIDDTKKIISYENFYEAGLSPTIEYGEKYCDIIYARRILNKMGYKVYVGMAFHVIKQEAQLKKEV